MHIFNLILLLILIIFYIFIITFKIKETFNKENLNIFGLKIFIRENEDVDCNANDKKKYKCGWDIIGTYPKKFPLFENIHMYNKPNIIIINKGKKGPDGNIGKKGNEINEDTRLKININKINEYTNKNLNINSNTINIESDNKIKLHEYTKICVGNNCLDNRIFKKIYNYFNNIENQENLIDNDLRPKYTHPDDCTMGKTCNFKNITTAKMFKAIGQICEFEPKYNIVQCKPL